MSATATTADPRHWHWHLWPDSLLGRVIVVLAAGLVCAQLAGSALWMRQLRESERAETLRAAQQLAHNAAGTILNFCALPHAQRLVMAQRLRGLGGSRFFIHFNPTRVALETAANSAFADRVTQQVHDALSEQLDRQQQINVTLTEPDTLQIPQTEQAAADIPANWLETTQLPHARPAPWLVIQYEMEPQHWIYLAAPMADPYFADPINPFRADRLTWQLLALLIVLTPTLLIVRGLIRPIDRIAAAAIAFDSASVPEPIAETGTTELRRTARAFNDMLARIQGYLVDRERLFVGISHSLKTPIMRLKLRTELLADDTLRGEFHQDLDDLDVMVKSALQSLRETDIHENLVAVRLNLLLERLCQRPINPDASVNCNANAIQVQGKPLALERAFGNLLDNAVLYGQRVEVRLSRLGSLAMVEIRDFGPGIPTASMAAAFELHTRLSHGRNSNRGGSGLGLGIANNIIVAHNGEIRLHNHTDSGLVVTVLLPALPDNDEPPCTL